VLLITLNPSNSTQCRAFTCRSLLPSFSSPIHHRSLRPSIPKGAPCASAALPHPPHQRHLLHLSVASQDSHRRQIRRPPSHRHRYRWMSSHRQIPSCRRRIASRRHRILSRHRRIVSHRHQVSSSPPLPPLSLRVLGAATVALLRMSRRRDALPRLTALPLRRRLSNALKTMAPSFLILVVICLEDLIVVNTSSGTKITSSKFK
jgi:hypothetical protein